MYPDPGHQYARDVVDGRTTACKYTKLACMRYLTDLDTAGETGMEFRPETARAYIQFFTKAIKHTVGKYAGQPFEPLPWQHFILWNIYGWYREDGTRRFNYAYITVARKNGKTTLLAGMALVALLLDREPAAEVYFAATKRDQAYIGFAEAARMARMAPLAKYLKARKHDVLAPQLNGRLTYLSSDHNTLDGLNIHFAAVDEYHSHPTDGVSNVLRSGMQARVNPLHVTITTAGFNHGGPCYEYQRTCKDILDGIKEDPAQFAVIYELDEDDKYTDPETWIKANPSLGETVRPVLLENQLKQALNTGGSKEVEFRTKHLNQWVTSSKTWIPDKIHMANVADFDTTNRECWAGLDLAAVSDLTALVMVFPDGEDLHVRGHYWLPLDTVRAVLDRDPGHIYNQFTKLPNVTITDGNVTDYAGIRRYLSGVHVTADGVQVDETNAMVNHRINAVAFDRYNSTQIAIDLTNDGVPLVPYGQGFVSMSPPTKEMEILVRSGRLKHDGCPVLRWALQNVALRTDPAGNIKPAKDKSAGKIDPVTALVMAIGERMKHEPAPNMDDVFTIVRL
jgi:phage terminase large subunit-like protein